MKQKLRRLMAGFLAVLTMFTTLLSNGTTAFAASPSANIAFWNASVKNVGEVSELKAGHSHTAKVLDGGKYTLYAGNDIKTPAGQVIITKGTALQTVTTGEDGKAYYTLDLPISNSYYISETQAPFGYIRNSSDVYSFNFNTMSETTAKATFSHEFANDRTTAKIHIYKVDKETGLPVPQGDASLEGSVYGLYAREDIMHPDGATGVVFKANDLVATLTTDAQGDAEVNNLYLGNYYVKEITPPEGYLLDAEEHDVVCDYEGDLVTEVSRSTTSKEQVYKQPFQMIKVPSSCLNSTISGLISRTFLRNDIIGNEDFHGAAFYQNLVKEDRTYEFINEIESRFDYNLSPIQHVIDKSGIVEVERIKDAYNVHDINLIKPGIGETTRVLLRRVPWKVLIDKQNKDSDELSHIIQLANEKNVSMEAI